MDKRPPVVYPDSDSFSIFGVGYDEIGAERQIGMGRRKLSRIENLSRSSGAAGKLGSIPRSNTFLMEITRFRNRVGRKRGHIRRFCLHCERYFRLGAQKAACNEEKNKNRAYLFHNVIIGMTKYKVKRIFQTAPPE
jgi:hypothetical protein